MVAEGTAGGTASGVLAEVSVSVTVAVLTQYDFACDFHLLMEGNGRNGFLRSVRMAVNDHSPRGDPCPYDGITSSSCSTGEIVAVSGSFGGAGIAGPANGQAPGWDLPTEIEVCPDHGYDYATAWNEGPQGLLAIKDIDYWECTKFGIHYTAVALDDLGGTLGDALGGVEGDLTLDRFSAA